MPAAYLVTVDFWGYGLQSPSIADLPNLNFFMEKVNGFAILSDCS
jgi:hypothetical protein